MTGSPHELVFQENDSFVYASARACPGCSRVLDDREVDADFELRNRTFDVSLTRDGAVVASQAFVDACSGLASVEFHPLPSEPGHALLHVARRVRVEPYASGVVTGLSCDRCGEPRYRVRRGPIHLVGGPQIEPGFSRTDLTFGDTADFGPDQPVRLRPHVLVDREAGRMLKQARLIGVHLIAQP